MAVKQDYNNETLLRDDNEGYRQWKVAMISEKTKRSDASGLHISERSDASGLTISERSDMSGLPISERSDTSGLTILKWLDASGLSSSK